MQEENATKIFRLTSLAMALALAGCSGKSAEPASELGDGAAFLVGTRIWDDTTTTSYFHVVPSLESGTTVDLGRALEVPGAAKLYAVADLGWFAVGGGEAPTITRYTLDGDGALVPGDAISLQQYGVADLWDTLYIVSPTKAYYPDRAGTQLIVWNPTSMEVTGSIALPETARDGYLALYGYAAIVRGSTLLVSVGWFDWNETDSVLAETGLVRIDTDADRMLGFDTDARCGGVTQPVTTLAGDTVLASSALAGAAHALGRLSTKPCALRVRADDATFDADFFEELESLTASAVSGEPIPAGDGSAFLRVFDEELGVVAEDSATYELTGQSAWRWVRWDLATNDVTPVSALAPSTSDVLWFQVDGHVYGTETKSDYSETTLIDLTAEGGPERKLTVPGFLHGLAKVR